MRRCNLNRFATGGTPDTRTMLHTLMQTCVARTSCCCARIAGARKGKHCSTGAHLTLFALQGVLVQKTWAGCYGCRTSFVDSESCPETGLKPDPCNAPPHLALSVSTYAAQLAWWFAHFPRARFKFITSKELHVQDPTPILNDILAFSGIDAAPFQAEMLRNVWEHNGGYDVTNLSSLDHKAIKFLQLYFQQANADLDALLGPDFGGIPPETLLE